jgi:hypothetical protein
MKRRKMASNDRMVVEEHENGNSNFEFNQNPEKNHQNRQG